MLYLAYGSNLLPARLQARIPSARLMGTCRIPGRRLEFRLCGSDGSAKCDIPAEPGGCAYGALYRLDDFGWARLDDIEGLGVSYSRLAVPVEDCPIACRAEAYIGLDGKVDGGLRPYGWYRRLVMAGARFHGFPREYLSRIEDLEPDEDPDRSRAARNLSVLRRQAGHGMVDRYREDAAGHGRKDAAWETED
jgi:hypothetical protein